MRRLVSTLLVLMSAAGQGQTLPAPAERPDAAHPTAPTHEQGWFFYQPLPLEPNPKKLQDKAANKSAVASPVPLGSAWLRANLPIYLDRAIDQPTLANIRRYRYLERLAMDRSSAFSDASARLTLLDPLLDEQQVSPLTALAKATRHHEVNQHRQRILETIAQNAGLWFFFRSDCPYCHAQVAALESLSRLHGFSILPISIDHKPLPGGRFPRFVADLGQASRLSVKVTPALFLVHRDGRVLPLATGLQTMDQIEFRITELGHALGWISNRELQDIQPLQHTVLDDFAAQLDPDADPDLWIDGLISKGKAHMGMGTPVHQPATESP